MLNPFTAGELKNIRVSGYPVMTAQRIIFKN
jgi:hypothetical protein